MNWQEERDATLCEARCVVVKVGSAVLSTGSELNLPVLDNLVNQLAVLSRQGRRVGPWPPDGQRSKNCPANPPPWD